MRHSTLVCLLFFAQNLLQAQSPSGLYLFKNFEKAYANGTRNADGMPGKNYWQNRSKYQIQVSLDPKKRLVEGAETVVYSNNSPDSLKMLRVKLQHDLYRKGAAHARDIAAKDVTDEGVHLKSLKINGLAVAEKSQERDGCFLDIKLDKALAGKSSLTLEVEWSFPMPTDADATRECVCDATSFFIPYFYPEIAVYDDLHGWADLPYNGLQEFYHDFSDYDVTVTVPAAYAVWATGEWQNPSDILTPGILDKWNRAHRSSDVISIFSEKDLKAGGIFKKGKKLAYHFLAKDVPDFTFAASDHYNWDATSVVADPKTGRRCFVSAAYKTEAEDFQQVAKIAAEGIHSMATYLPGYPFPYPCMTIFNGNDGMEYPMMVNDATAGPEFVWNLTVHEVAHTYMPFMMGINEQYYGWMDEGWANFFEEHICDSLRHQMPHGGRGGYGWSAGSDFDVPPMVPTRFLSGRAFGIQSYSRPQAAYDGLLELLGFQEFRKCLHAYMDTWKGKHPGPYDFFNTFSRVSGQNLDWYWKPWFFEYGHPDLGIKTVDNDAPELRPVVVVERAGTLPVPINLEVKYEDGGIEKFSRSAEVWKTGETTVRIVCPPGKKVVSAKIGGPGVPDGRSENNRWSIH